MSYLTDLTTTRDQYVTILKSLSENPKPSYNVDGQAFSWTEYQKFLTEQIKSLNGLIAAGDPDSQPFEVVSQGFNV